MLKKYEPLYHNVVFYYTLIYAIYSLFGRFTWLHGLVEHTINAPLYSFTAIFGLMLVAIDFFFYKNYKQMRYYPIYIVFIVCAVISSALNFKYGFVDNAKTIVWLTVQMGLFTTMGQLISKERYQRWLTLFFSISGSIWGFASLVSLYQFIYVPGYRIPMNGRLIRQSLYDNRLFGVFIDPNLGAFVAFLVIWGMIYLILRSKKNKLVITLCTTNCIIQFLYIVLSGSRSTQVCMIVSISYALLYSLVHYYKKTNKIVKPLRLLSYLAVPVLCVVIIFSSFSILKTSMASLAEQIVPSAHKGVEELERTDIEEDSSNNRVDIWKGYLTLLKDKPIFGLSPRNAWNYADTEHPESYLAAHHDDVHNAYIAVLAGMGIVGFLVLLGIMYCLFKTMIPRLFATDKMNLPYFIALQLIINIAVFILFYPGIYFTNGIDTILFWIAIGFVVKEAKPGKLSFRKQAN